MLGIHLLNCIYNLRKTDNILLYGYNIINYAYVIVLWCDWEKYPFSFFCCDGFLHSSTYFWGIKLWNVLTLIMAQ